MPGDLTAEGDERLNNMEQVVLKPQNLPELLQLQGYDLPIQELSSFSNLFDHA